MRFWLLFKTDLVEGFRAIWRGLLVSGLLAVTTGLLIPVIGPSMTSEFDAGALTAGDYLIFPFCGIEEILWNPGMRISLPAAWMAFCALALYGPLWYPYRDLMGFGQNVLVRAEGRITWWLSKACWTVDAMLAWMAVVGCGLGACAVVAGALPSLDVHQFLVVAAGVDPAFLLAGARGAAPFLLGLAAALVALALLQLSLSLVFRPVVGYGCSVVLLALSALVMNPVLPGEYLMAARSSLFSASGFDPLVGMAVAACIAMAALLFGGWKFATLDILDKEY